MTSELDQVKDQLALAQTRRYGGAIDISAKIETLKEYPQQLTKIYKTIMQKGTDYDKIPGTPKPTLLKPGAEILCRWLNLSPVTEIIGKLEDIHLPYFDYTVKTTLYNIDGGIVADASGSANTREDRYAFRWIKKSDLGQQIKYYETENRNGVEYVKIDTPPNQIFGLKNTVLKMADKRSLVAVTLKATGASRIFTQDMEDKKKAVEKEAVENATKVGNGPAKESTFKEPDPKDCEPLTEAELKEVSPIIEQVKWVYEDEKGNKRLWKPGEFGFIKYKDPEGNDLQECYALIYALDNHKGAFSFNGEMIFGDEVSFKIYRKKMPSA